MVITVLLLPKFGQDWFNTLVNFRVASTAKQN